MFTATSLVVLLLALWSVLALAQTGPQNASIPNCIRACDTQAIKASYCASEDQYCHCLKYTTILDNIVPCVQHNSTCANGTSDLLSMCGRSFDDTIANQCSIREIVRRRLPKIQLIRPYKCNWQHNSSQFISYPDAVYQSSFCGQCMAS
jgi:vesicle coat complex subunit